VSKVKANDTPDFMGIPLQRVQTSFFAAVLLGMMSLAGALGFKEPAKAQQLSADAHVISSGVPKKPFKNAGRLVSVQKLALDLSSLSEQEFGDRD